ncbi:hypothetical protein [Tengunoibacter tsumagoiensis]|uniref:Uncharacterized protein n=1 Tax=Tengunoibacter tsumagoiensis TaxID=2014871 RepID=A0A402A076_9CHLR|nr:hypothetical protein [Tengunoibacter tsumagoiensis]GCE12557.1 hypothetical protein KTT_24160 [Tengunoibacter tsumagoiensis]
MYNDKTYPFTLTIPIGWNETAFSTSSADQSSTFYQIWLTPKSLPHPASAEEALRYPEAIQFTVLLSGPSADYTKIGFTPEADPVVIDHIQTPFYQRTSPNCGEVNFAAGPITIGGKAYSFYLETRDPPRKEDVAIFLKVLQSFTYTG